MKRRGAGLAHGPDRYDFFNHCSAPRDLCGEAQLWVEAISQEIAAARSRLPGARRDAARMFLEGRTHALAPILLLLGIDPAWWRTRALPELVRSWSTIDDAGPRERPPELVERYRRAAQNGAATRAARRR